MENFVIVTMKGLFALNALNALGNYSNGEELRPALRGFCNKCWWILIIGVILMFIGAKAEIELEKKRTENQYLEPDSLNSEASGNKNK